MNTAPASVRRQRIAWALGCWLAATCLIVGQFLILRHLADIVRESRGAIMLVPSESWRLRGTLVPLLLILAALVMQTHWLRGFWKGLSVLALYLFVPAMLFCMLIALLRGPNPLETVRLSGGRFYTLAIEPIMTDSVYTLYEDADVAGLVWRQAGDLDYSEDGRFVGGERLVVSPGERWMVVGRAGLWTDCFRIVEGRPVAVRVPPSPDWSSPDYEPDMRLRSQRIATLTGLQP